MLLTETVYCSRLMVFKFLAHHASSKDYLFYVTAFLGSLVILSPLSNLPVFLEFFVWSSLHMQTWVLYHGLFSSQKSPDWFFRKNNSYKVEVLWEWYEDYTTLQKDFQPVVSFLKASFWPSTLHSILQVLWLIWEIIFCTA